MFYFIEQMKLEVIEADKTIKGLQADVRILREKNKELERKFSVEKMLREGAEAKVKPLKKKLRELKDMLPEGALDASGRTKSSQPDSASGDEVIIPPLSSERPPKANATQRM